MSSETAQLKTACRLLEEGNYEQALQSLQGAENSPSAVRKSLWLTVSAQIAERDGDSALAGERFAQAHALGVPLRASLHACAKYFKRTGQYEKAFHDYSILQNLFPNALGEFAEGLPDPELCRYAPVRAQHL